MKMSYHDISNVNTYTSDLSHYKNCLSYVYYIAARYKVVFFFGFFKNCFNIRKKPITTYNYVNTFYSSFDFIHFMFATVYLY